MPNIDELCYLTQTDKVLKNTHPHKNFLIEIIDMGYLLLQPGQFYVFDSHMKFLKTPKNRNEWGFNNVLNIRYKIYGHSPIYSIKL